MQTQLEQALSEANGLREQLMFVQAGVDVSQQDVVRLERARDVLSLRYAQTDTALRVQAGHAKKAVLWTGARTALGLGPSGAARKALHRLALWCVYVRANTDMLLSEAYHSALLFCRAGIAWKLRAVRVGFVEMRMSQLSHRLPRPLAMPRTFVAGDNRTEALQLVSGLYRANSISLEQRDVLKEAMQSQKEIMQTALGQQAPVANATAPPAPTVNQWSISVNGQVRGPYTDDQMRQYIAAGQVTAQTNVWKQSMGQEWLPAAQVPELLLTFGSTPPPPPPA